MSTFLSSLFGKKRPSGCSKENEMGGHKFFFNYEEIKEATKSFSTELGVGYLGELRDGRKVAVKVLYDPNNPEQFKQIFDKITVLSRIRHKNLVTLYGCTNPRARESILVYEYVPNGTVADHIHGRRPALTWALRIKIAIQTAEALAYLHACEPPIIHGDVKTANLLLDDDFSVKVADLGLYQILPWGKTHLSTMPQGTIVYRDPEYDRFLRFTDKSDVYSFGVVLVQLISGKKAVDVNRDPEDIYLDRRAPNMIINKMLDELVDPELGYHFDGDVMRMINSVAELAYKCLQVKAIDRPPMVEVLKILKGIEHGRQDIQSDDKGLNEIVVEATEQTSKHTTDEGRGSMDVDTKGIKHGKQPLPVEYEGLKDLGLKELKLKKQQTHGQHEDDDAEGIKLADDDVKGIEYVDDIREVCVFSYEELEKATNTFDTARELVNGGSGRVYLGNLQDGQIVAVKVLIDPNTGRLEQFFDDVVILSRIRHDNLVALYGCTKPHDQELLLVYEFVPNGSIADHLHGQRPTLTWDVRIEIALETAQALGYLHTHKPPIIYRDLNTSNILVDNAFHAKLANLSESRFLPLEIKQASIVLDTMGYQNPKNDVYSFGKVLLELISGKLVGDMVLKSISNKEQEILVDPKLGNDFGQKFRTTVSSLSGLAARCINHTGTMRPCMLEVITKLQQIKDEMRQKHSEDKQIQEEEEEEEEANVLGLFTHEELSHATNSWDLLREISYGGDLNKVYLGKFRDIRAVAVKVVKNRNLEQLKEMINDVKVISRRPHKNLLTFYGYTSPLSNQDMLLVYEYVNLNGTVADHIQGMRPSLTWALRIKIATETAEALTHLHFGCGKRIIHGCLRSSNILLDSSFNVKISCLGKHDLLATPEDMEGYQKPDSNENHVLTEMRDVYSFGLVLVELISGKQTVEIFHMVESYSAGEELNKIIKMGLNVIVDPKLEYNTNSHVQQKINSLAELASRCLKKDTRPSMWDVVTRLKEIKGADFASNPIKGEAFTYEELCEATNSFDASRELGRDFFDRTYLGKLRDERKVAVKLLAHRTVEILEPLFKDVMANIAGHRHESLATLYGCTIPRLGEMFLVHEYVPNNTLEYYLHKKRGAFITSILHWIDVLKREKRGALNWSLRIRIAIETAEALSYLHSQDPPIIHGSLTTYNILLDDSFRVKVSGVNLFIRRSLEEAGHFCKDGYDDPMYTFKDLPTEKVDVFSFGVVLFVLISGLQAVDSNRETNSVYLYNMGLEKMLYKQMDQFVDIRLDYHSDADTKRMINSVAELARMCLDMKQNMRPTMMEALSALKVIKEAK